ncbi:hypothetical protein diail_4776 [Diaporthe ilicicola]|nr:hypothetical protein diail_4776 [Diaporthe ilicicola]
MTAAQGRRSHRFLSRDIVSSGIPPCSATRRAPKDGNTNDQAEAEAEASLRTPHRHMGDLTEVPLKFVPTRVVRFRRFIQSPQVVVHLDENHDRSTISVALPSHQS